MITIVVDGKEYAVPTGWEQINFSRYSEIVAAQTKSIEHRLSAFSGIPITEVGKLSFEQAQVLMHMTDFMHGWELAAIYSTKYSDELNIGHRSYNDIEKAKQAISKAKTQHVLCGAELVKIYYGEDISQQPITDCLGKVLWLMESINKFLEPFRELGDYEPTVDEIQAGVEELNKFGSFATVVQLARKYAKTHDEILAMPAKEIYTVLLLDYTNYKISKNLQSIQAGKTKLKPKR